MRNLSKFFAIALVILGIVAGILVFYPKSIDLSIDGVLYRLGEDSFEPVTLIIQGRVFRSITGNETFKGIIDIDGLKIPVPEEQRYIEAPFSNNSLPIIYDYYMDNAAYHYSVGTLFCDENRNKFTILLLEDKDGEPNIKTWNCENGLMISAPSNDKNEGMNVSKQLLPQEYGVYFK